MRKCIWLTLMLLTTVGTAMAKSRIFVQNVKTLVATVNNDWLNMPIIVHGSNDVMRVGFDEMSHDYHRYVYRLEHCEADWSPSTELFESDWLEGFNNIPIDDYTNSINTTVLYTHYQLEIPNDKCRLKMSGNYRLTVYDEDNNDEKVLEAEFRVLEELMTVGIDVTTNTDIDVNKSHQQVSMSVNYGQLNVTNTQEQIYTVVMQNWRDDNAKYNIKPNYTLPKGLSWEHNRQLIFDAGNEYHKYEILDVSHPTMGIDQTGWDGKTYHAYPFVDTARRNYLTDVDADGAFCIRNSENNEVEYTCDYVTVHYQLEAPYMGDIYVDGHWTTASDRNLYKMHYADGAYHAEILQKQGYYSYQYIGEDGKAPTTEGSFYQTENRYQVLVYYKATGERTWRLVGYRTLIFN